MLAPYPLLTRISRIKEEIAYFQALLGLKKKQEIERMILRVAQEEGVDGRTLLAVAKAESGLNPKAVNLNQDGSKDFGLFQLNDKWYKDIVFDEATEDPEMSARIAARRFKQGFMSDWTSVKSGAYKKYL
jgi:soluble lytic murein transglycosylase-like protein